MEASAPFFGLAIWLRPGWIFRCQPQAGARAGARLRKTCIPAAAAQRTTFIHSEFVIRNSTLVRPARSQPTGQEPPGARWELTAMRQITGTETGKSELLIAGGDSALPLNLHGTGLPRRH